MNHREISGGLPSHASFGLVDRWSSYSYLVWHLCLSDLQEVPTVVAALLFVSAKLCSSHENKMAFSYGPAVFNKLILTSSLFL